MANLIKIRDLNVGEAGITTTIMPTSEIGHILMRTNEGYVAFDPQNNEFEGLDEELLDPDLAEEFYDSLLTPITIVRVHFEYHMKG